MVRAATELMMREGVAAATTRAVATELGVGQATIHYAFGSKHELHKAVLLAVTQEILSDVQAAAPPAAADFATGLRFFVDRLWESVTSAPERHHLVAELSLTALREPVLRASLQEHQRSVNEAIAGIIAAVAQDCGQELTRTPQALARAFVAAHDGLVVQYLTDQDAQAGRDCLLDLVTTMA
ncbi:hypothetical protein GCM10027456_67890 [Kineosporia babensis]|nr:TetR family transcriptional regulator [Kineosporia babensis]